MTEVIDKAPKPRSPEEQERLWRSIMDYGNGDAERTSEPSGVTIEPPVNPLDHTTKIQPIYGTHAGQFCNRHGCPGVIQLHVSTMSHYCSMCDYASLAF